MDLTEFTTEELLALASGLELPNPAFLASEPFESWAPEVRAEVDAIGRRSLAARSVIEVDDDGTARIPELLASLCRLLSHPDVYVRISNIDSAGYRTAGFLITHELCAGMRLTRLGNYRFTLIDAGLARSAMDEILQLGDATPDDEPLNGEIEVAVEDLQRLIAERESQPDEELEELLRQSGLSTDVSEALLPLMTDSTVGWSVDVFAPSIESRTLEGSSTTWVATSDGRWVATTKPAEGEARVTYRRQSAGSIQSSILDGFPNWLKN